MASTPFIEKEINSHIPEASRIARDKVKVLSTPWVYKDGVKTGSMRDTRYKHDLWTEYFHQAMNKLTADAGLRILSKET